MKIDYEKTTQFMMALCSVLMSIAIILTMVLLMVAISKKAYASPDMNFSGVVIHHTVSNRMTLDDCYQWHVVERNFDECGYHFILSQEGAVIEARSLTKAGEHARNPSPSRNRSHIGIALVGYATFSDAQHEALQILHRKLEQRFGTLSIERHHEQCPGKGLKL